MPVQDERYECKKCGGTLSRNSEGEHFSCEDCGCIVAPETVKKNARKLP